MPSLASLPHWKIPMRTRRSRSISTGTVIWSNEERFKIFLMRYFKYMQVSFLVGLANRRSCSVQFSQIPLDWRRLSPTFLAIFCSSVLPVVCNTRPSIRPFREDRIAKKCCSSSCSDGPTKLFQISACILECTRHTHK